MVAALICRNRMGLVCSLISQVRGKLRARYILNPDLMSSEQRAKRV